MKPFRFAESAESTLADIFDWSYANFGAQRADTYLTEILKTCENIASGSAHTQSCSILMRNGDETRMRFARSGQHLIIYEEQENVFGIIDLLHSRSDLGSKLDYYGSFDG